ncbi:MAG: OmpH family outer membrane protein [Gemmataceae bacterium]
MKRVFVYLAALVGVGSAVYLAGTIQAQAPGAAPAAPKASGKVAVFNVAKVMKDFQRWQHFANVMNQKRATAAGDLGKLKNEIAELQAKIQQEPIKQKQEEIAKVLVAKQREFEDKERQVRTALDDESANYLRELFQQIQACVKAVVDANGFDVVFSYPDAISAQEMSSPLYFDLKLRPQAAMPFYVSAPADMTDVLVQTLNANFKAPAGAAPPAPTPPGAGQPPAAPGKQ